MMHNGFVELGHFAGGAVEVAMADADGGGGVKLVTGPVLLSLAKHTAKVCAAQNTAFVDCKRADADPAKCLQQGTAVTSCLLSLLQDVNSKCGASFNKYVACMDYYSNDFESCRKEERAFHKECPLP
eukprot:jgi/Chlat1/4682/Chrsp3S05619